MRFTLWQRALSLLILPFMMDVAIIAALWGTLRNVDEQILQQFNSNDFIVKSNQILQGVSELQLQMRGRADNLMDGASAPHPPAAGSQSGEAGETQTNNEKGIGKDKDLLNLAAGLEDKLTALPKFAGLDESIANTAIERVRALREKLADALNSETTDDPQLRYNSADEAANKTDEFAQEIEKSLDNLQHTAGQLNTQTLARQRQLNQTVWLLIFAGVGLNVAACWTLLRLFRKQILVKLSLLEENMKRLSLHTAPVTSGKSKDEFDDLNNTFCRTAQLVFELEDRERALWQQSGASIFVLNSDMLFLEFNQSACLYFGYVDENLREQSFLSLIKLEQRETVRTQFEAIKKTGIDRLEVELQRHTGETITSILSVTWSASSATFFCVAHDFTLQKLIEQIIQGSEERVRQQLNTMRSAVLVLDEIGMIRELNSVTGKMFKCQSEQIEGHHVLSLFPEVKMYDEYKDEDRSSFFRELKQNSLNKVFQKDARDKTGEDFACELIMGKVDEEQTEEEFVLNILDVSDVKKSEKMRKEFVSTVSHELRTPLTAVRGSLTLLLSGGLGELPEKAEKQISVAERNVLRLIGLINDMLDIEKLESGKLDMAFDHVNIKTIFERSLENVTTFADNYGVRIELLPIDLDVIADTDRLIQVLVNLMSNAIKFSPKDSTVTVRAERKENQVLFQVIDRGRGIPEKFKKLLFQRFQQVEAADAKMKGGTGLGLAICKGIVEAHNGEIGVDSEEGKGSTFWFRIAIERKRTADMEMT